MSQNLAAGARPQARAMPGKLYAALDLGTNNCRLLVATPHEQGVTNQVATPLKVLDSFSRVVRLGEGVSASGILSQEAMERTLKALQQCQKKLSRYHLAGSRFVATEACRRASNAPAFMERIFSETGLEIEIISSEDEAKLAFLGCSSLLPGQLEQAIVFDIGGGSTELMWIHPGRAKGAHDTTQITDWLSIGFGVMNLADKFGGTNFSDLAYDDMVKLIESYAIPFHQNNHGKLSGGDGPTELLSTSGTVTTLAAIHLDLPRYDRSRIDGIRLKISDIRATIERLLNMRPFERFNHPCIGADRADFIISGCAIFEAIGRIWPDAYITIADRGVREGIILSLMKGTM